MEEWASKNDMKAAELNAGTSETESVWSNGSSKVRRAWKWELSLPNDKSRWVSEDGSPNNIGLKTFQLRPRGCRDWNPGPEVGR